MQARTLLVEKSGTAGSELEQINMNARIAQLSWFSVPSLGELFDNRK